MGLYDSWANAVKAYTTQKPTGFDTSLDQGGLGFNNKSNVFAQTNPGEFLTQYMIRSGQMSDTGAGNEYNSFLANQIGSQLPWIYNYLTPTKQGNNPNNDMAQFEANYINGYQNAPMGSASLSGPGNNNGYIDYNTMGNLLAQGLSDGGTKGTGSANGFSRELHSTTSFDGQLKTITDFIKATGTSAMSGVKQSAMIDSLNMVAAQYLKQYNPMDAGTNGVPTLTDYLVSHTADFLGSWFDNNVLGNLGASSTPGSAGAPQ